MKRRLLLGLAAIAAAAAVVFAAWYLRLPPSHPKARPAAIPEDEQAALVQALKPRRPRPVVAVLGDNAGTETTDYLVPFAVLSESGVADVRALATGPGPIRMQPALTVEPQETVAQFDARVPDGADYVVVPALRDPRAPAAVAFIRAQHAKGATVVGICAGGLVVAEAGLVDGRRATTHWFYADGLRRAHPTMTWVTHHRYVVDRGVATTTGVTASIPVSLALVEAIGGRERAQQVAESLGVASWDARHDSAAFGLDRRAVRTVVANRLAFWRRETLELPVAAGDHEIAVALTADAWSRTYRSRALAVAPAPVALRHGIRLVPDGAAASGAALPAVASAKPALALDTALAAIAGRYGLATADFVATQLEYPR